VNEQEFREALLSATDGYISGHHLDVACRFYREAMGAKDEEWARSLKFAIPGAKAVYNPAAIGSAYVAEMEAKDRRIAELETENDGLRKALPGVRESLDAFSDSLSVARDQIEELVRVAGCRQCVVWEAECDSRAVAVGTLRADMERVTKERDEAREDAEQWKVYHADDEPSWRHAAEAREREASALREELAQEREKRQAVERVHVKSLVQMRKQLAEAQRDASFYKQSYEELQAGSFVTVGALRTKLEAAGAALQRYHAHRHGCDLERSCSCGLDAAISKFLPLTHKESPNE
jgi:flagellar biosynthesis GTPase FlhF